MGQKRDVVLWFEEGRETSAERKERNVKLV